MSTFDYLDLAKTTADLLLEFGVGAGLKRNVNGGTSTRGCQVLESQYLPREMNGSTIQETDRRFMCTALNLNPPPSAEEDKLIYEGIPFRIITVSQIKPAETTVVYELQVRL